MERRPVAEERMETSEAAAEGGEMVACELEAASALTDGDLGSGEWKGQLVVIDSECTDEEIVENIPSQLCSVGCQSNPARKLNSSKSTELALLKRTKLAGDIQSEAERCSSLPPMFLDSHSDTTNPSTGCLCSEQSTRTDAAISDSKINPVSIDNVHGAAFTHPPDICQYTEDSITCINVNVLGHENEELIIGPDGSRLDREVLVSVASADENMGHGSLGEENEEPMIVPDTKLDKVCAATVARRKRKELMELKK